MYWFEIWIQFFFKFSDKLSILSINYYEHFEFTVLETGFREINHIENYIFSRRIRKSFNFLFTQKNSKQIVIIIKKSHESKRTFGINSPKEKKLNCILWCHICMWNILRIKHEKLKKKYIGKWKRRRRQRWGQRQRRPNLKSHYPVLGSAVNVRLYSIVAETIYTFRVVKEFLQTTEQNGWMLVAILALVALCLCEWMALNNKRNVL